MLLRNSCRSAGVIGLETISSHPKRTLSFRPLMSRTSFSRSVDMGWRSEMLTPSRLTPSEVRDVDTFEVDTFQGHLTDMHMVLGAKRDRRRTFRNVCLRPYPDITASITVAKIRSLSEITRNAFLTTLRIPTSTGSIRAFARSSFGLSALGVTNFLCCVNFFRFIMVSPCGHCIAINHCIVPYSPFGRRRRNAQPYSRQK
jgi:hypothetical protein